MEQNPCSIIAEVTKPSGVSLDELNSAIETFSRSIIDSVPAVIEQSCLVAPEQPDQFLDRLLTTSHGITRLRVKESFGYPLVVIVPELSKRPLDAPSSTGLQVELVQRTKRDSLSATPIRIALKLRPFAVSRRRGAGLSQTTMLLFAHRINRVSKIFGDMEPVMHDVGLGNACFYRTDKCRPHIHDYRFDRVALGIGQFTQQAFGRSQLALRYQINCTGTLDIGQYADVAVSALGSLFIKPKLGNAFLFSTQHASLHSTHHDVIDGAPGESRKFTDAFGDRTDMQQLDHKTLYRQGNSAVALSPKYSQLLNTAVAVFELGHACLNDRLELAGIQMSPLTFVPTINMSKLGSIRWIEPSLPALKNKLNQHTLIRQSQVDRFHRSW